MNNGRATINQSPGLLSITVPSKKNWLAIVFAFFWLGMWFFALINVGDDFLKGKMDGGGQMFTAFWLAGWTFGGLAAVFFVLWGLFGKEKLLAGYGEVTFQKSILGIGPTRKLTSPDVKNFRTELGNDSWIGRNRWAFWGMGPGKIKFDYGMKTYSFGLAVDDAEAEHIVKLLSEFFKR